jgi:hypothetical protein
MINEVLSNFDSGSAAQLRTWLRSDFTDMVASLSMQNDRLEDCLRLRMLYEEKLKPGPYPTTEVTPGRFPEPAPGTLLMYLAGVAGIASHGEKLIGLAGIRREQFRNAVAESFAEKWPQISQQISPNVD